MLRVGSVYRAHYTIEHVVPFLSGQLAMASAENRRYYLQSVPLRKRSPERMVRQYRSLVHEAWLPVSRVYEESRQLVLVRPFLPLVPLSEVLIRHGKLPVSFVLSLGRQLLDFALLLELQMVPLRLMLDLRNVGMTGDGSFKVLGCTVPRVTEVAEGGLDWGTWFFCLLSGELHDKPMISLPFPIPLRRSLRIFIDKIFGEIDPNRVLGHLEECRGRRFLAHYRERWGWHRDIPWEKLVHHGVEPSAGRPVAVQQSVPPVSMFRDRKITPPPVVIPWKQGDSIGHGLQLMESLTARERSRWTPLWQKTLRGIQKLQEEQALYERHGQSQMEQRRLDTLRAEQDLLEGFWQEVQQKEGGGCV
ncbi:hypothetical protein [Pasteuria penetrans]|uniref:hypothetical protein n=1 Tax=Pasteuria penetrans TaxID=86005 RepID=UPI0011EC44AF|nr:hypothetical protein [Pasteuria penetrans]